MAARLVVSSKHLKRLRNFIRPFASSSSPAVAVNHTAKAEPTFQKSPTNTSLSLDADERLFSSVPTSKLLRASATLHAAAIEPMVDFGTWVMQSKLMDVDLVKSVVLGVVRRTFFGHFCAGEDTAAAGESVRRLYDSGLRAMLDYSVEYADDNASCDRNLNAFLRTVESAMSLPSSSVSSVIVKITAICPMRLLERVSDLLRWQHKDPSFVLPWKMETLPIFSESSPTYHTLQEPEPLTREEEHDLRLAHERLSKICQKCIEVGVTIAIDAEYTSIQPAIDYFTYSSAILYNKDNTPIVHGTIQAYLKDAKERLLLATETAEKMGLAMGFKLVRGAYMSSEAKLASSLGFESPIHNSIQETHACYNECASYLLEKICQGPGALVLATHNVESGRIAVEKARDLGTGKVNHKLQFAQLYGMADALSFSLRNAGFQVSKYMPFGPIQLVMPYLLRRAEENRGLLSASTLDRHLMRKELQKRLVAAAF